MKIGMGYDVHALVENRKFIIGGVDIAYTMGLLGHSDADVLVHSIMDSILGALGEGDIGKHFPDTEEEYKDISSMILLKRVYDIMKNKGYKIGNIDATIVAQMPKMAPFIEQMRTNVAEVLHCEIEDINIKATTTEWLGFEGREEGIASYSVCLLEKEIDKI
ncbi:MAG: 2-C-methyl-D-erythritol 2,4-cyclodiphosphate synthase [Gudongella sp.]|jgi:2-C-methyl-D-erythritol 2,4-cyclodiphosphate synthase|nr:2-C-methyl-D-erythritol 2,4-cyclodiphosphate synthase [Gudongella sp.]